MNAELLHGFYLDELLVEPSKGCISGPHGSRHLPPKGMEVLLCLASRPGEVVTREALLDEVWGHDRGSQEALSHAVSEVRQALDDHPDQPRYVQTLPKRGYRLLVTPVLASADTSTVVIGAEGGVRLSDLSLFENLKQRGVLETAIAYLILGWLMIQVADIVFEQLLFPQWAGTFVTVLVIAGFPIAIALSWFLEFRHGRAVVDTLSASKSRRRRFSRTYLSVISGLAVAGVLVLIYDRSIGLPEAEPPAPGIAGETFALPPVLENSIAVLPFLNIDGSSATQIFANGLVDDVITRLAGVPGLLVSARGDSYTLEPNTASQRVRERLRVAMYLEGSVQMLDDELRVIVQLIDSETGFHKLSRSFDRPREGFFDIRDEITELMVANVRVALPPETRDVSASLEADPALDVYIAYRRGVDASRRPDVKEWIDEAIEWFDTALDIDPEYAAAHAGKCDAYVEGFIWLDDAAYIAAAEASCSKALNLNPNLDVVYAALGDLYEATGRFELADDAYADALRINAENVPALIGLGEVYRQQQRVDEAEATLRQAIGLLPGDWSAYNALGRFLYRSGRYAEAAENFRTVVALDRSNVRGHTNLATSLVLAAEFEAAEPVFRRALELDPTADTYVNFGLLLYYLARYEESVQMLRNAVELESKDYWVRLGLGDALWAAGMKTQSRTEFAHAERLAGDVLAVNPNDAYTLMDLAWIKMKLDKDEEANELIRQAMTKVPDDPYVYYIQGLMLNRSGDVAGALDALGSAVELGYSTKMLSVDPNLSELRNEKRFQELIALSN